MSRLTFGTPPSPEASIGQIAQRNQAGAPPIATIRPSGTPPSPETRVAPEFIEIPKSHLFSPAEAAARELWARRFVAELTGVARGLGYGLFHGGSLIRDIDVVAVPWRQGSPDRTFGPVEFVLELCHCLPLHMGNHGTTLFGHHWYALWHDAHRDHQIDLKVILPARPPA